MSGGRPLGDRPEGAKLLAALRPGDAVVATKLDRMFRNARDALNTAHELKARGIRLFLRDMEGDVTGNGVSALFFTIMSAVAAFERDRIGERIREGKRQAKQAGKYSGGRKPFGYRIEHVTGRGAAGEPVRVGVLRPDPREQAVIAELRRLREEGWSLREIAATAGERGHRLSHVAVQRLLARGAAA